MGVGGGGEGARDSRSCGSWSCPEMDSPLKPLGGVQLHPRQTHSTHLTSKTVENKSISFEGPQVPAASGNRSPVQVQGLSRTPWAHQGVTKCNVASGLKETNRKCWPRLPYESSVIGSR